MIAMSGFWLDASVLIQAANDAYRFDMVPKFWSFIDKQLGAGVIRCPLAVFDELTKGKDTLAQWCKVRKSSGLCVRPTKEIQITYRAVIEHVEGICTPPQLAIFAGVADGWLIASAMATKGVVVTQESQGGKRATLKIPKLCKELSVKCLRTSDMLAALNFRT
jgi:hypothetical protein